MSFNAFGFPPSMTTMTGNTVLKWWPEDIPILAIGIPHEEFITKYCPHARPQGIARLDGHRLVINRRGDLTVTKVRRRPVTSSSPTTTPTAATAQPTEDTTSPWPATLEFPSLPKDLTTNDNNTYPTTNTATRSPSRSPSRPTTRPAYPGPASRSTPAPLPTQAPGAWPESNLTPTPTPNPAPSPAPIPSTDLNNSATSFASSSTTVSHSHAQVQNQAQHQHVDNDPHSQVWGLVYLLTRTQYARFQRQHLSRPSTSQPQPQLRPRQHGQPQLRLPRPFGIPMIFTRQNEARASTRRQDLPEVQVHFFQHDLLRQSAARQATFPETAGDAVRRHLSEVRDLRLVRVLVRHGVDADAVADAVSDAVAAAAGAGDDNEASSEGREGVETELTWREQREKERREEMVRGLMRWSKDLERRGVPTNWLRKVVGGLVERVERGEVGGEVGQRGEDGDEEEEVLGVVNRNDEEVVEGEDEGELEGRIIEAMDNIARVVRGASREVMGFARRGVEALVAQFTGEEEGEEQEWELVEFPDQRGRGRRREGEGF